METPAVQDARTKLEKLLQIKESIVELKQKEKEVKTEFVAAMQKANLDEIILGDKKYELELVEDVKVRTRRA